MYMGVVARLEPWYGFITVQVRCTMGLLGCTLVWYNGIPSGFALINTIIPHWGYNTHTPYKPILQLLQTCTETISIKVFVICGTDFWAATATAVERNVDLVSFPPNPPPTWRYIGCHEWKTSTLVVIRYNIIIIQQLFMQSIRDQAVSYCHGYIGTSQITMDSITYLKNTTLLKLLTIKIMFYEWILWVSIVTYQSCYMNQYIVYRPYKLGWLRCYAYNITQTEYLKNGTSSRLLPFKIMFYD